MARTCDLGMRSGRRKSNGAAGCSALRLLENRIDLLLAELPTHRSGPCSLGPLSASGTRIFNARSAPQISPFPPIKTSVSSAMASNILVVDDSVAIRKILQRVLRQTGMEIGDIREAGDGGEALGLLKTTQVQLVLSDINMPNMDGLRFLEAVKNARL